MHQGSYLFDIANLAKTFDLCLVKPCCFSKYVTSATIFCCACVKCLSLSLWIAEVCIKSSFSFLNEIPRNTIVISHLVYSLF